MHLFSFPSEAIVLLLSDRFGTKYYCYKRYKVEHTLFLIITEKWRTRSFFPGVCIVNFCLYDCT